MFKGKKINYAEFSSRLIKDSVFKILIYLFTFLSVVPLLMILFYLVQNGIGAINWQFLFQMPAPIGESGGGIANAIVGTLLLIIFASIFALPLGVMAGIYLSENKDQKLAYYIRLSVEILQGVPSIVIGIVIYSWFVSPFKAYSGLAGGIALGIMMLPLIVRTTEETLLLIPDSLKEAALALGVPNYKTILRVILPAGMSGIFTGILLSISRIAGETAPLMFTAFGSSFMNVNIFKPISSMPILIYSYASSPYQDWQQKAWGASLLLVIFVLSLNILSKWMVKKWKVS